MIVLGAAAIGLGVIATKGVARFGGHGDGGHRCAVDGGDRCRACSSGILVVERHGVLVGSPLGIERSGLSNVPNVCACTVSVIVLGAATVDFGVVAAECVARLGGYGDSRHGSVVVGGDRCRACSGGFLVVERHGVLVDCPSGDEGDVLAGGGVATADGKGQRRGVSSSGVDGIGIGEAVEGVAGARGSVDI